MCTQLQCVSIDGVDLICVCYIVVYCLFCPLIIVKEVVNRRARTRRHTELAIKSAARRLTLKDLSDLLQQLDGLVCHVNDSDQLQVSSGLFERLFNPLGTEMQAVIWCQFCFPVLKLYLSLGTLHSGHEVYTRCAGDVEL